MIYLLAVFIPPLALLLNGQPFSAIFSVILIVACFLLGPPPFSWFRPCTPSLRST